MRRERKGRLTVSLLQPLPPGLSRRLPRVLGGLLLLGVGYSAVLQADLGVDPWNALHQGLARHVDLPVGTVSIIVGLVVLLGWIPLRQRLGLGTVVNAVMVGVVIDVVLAATTRPRTWPVRWSCLGCGIGLVGVGSALYIGAGLGPGPRDGLMTGIAARGPSLRMARTAVELTVLGAGWVLGGNVGVGTALFAVTVGPVIHHMFPRLAVRS